MNVEVIIRDHVGGYRSGQVVTIEDGVLLRALLKGKKAEVLNPPDWDPGDEEFYEPYKIVFEDELGTDPVEHVHGSGRHAATNGESASESEGTRSEGYRDAR